MSTRGTAADGGALAMNAIIADHRAPKTHVVAGSQHAL
jgi:hypothetical protein